MDVTSKVAIPPSRVIPTVSPLVVRSIVLARSAGSYLRARSDPMETLEPSPIDADGLNGLSPVLTLPLAPAISRPGGVLLVWVLGVLRGLALRLHEPVVVALRPPRVAHGE